MEIQLRPISLNPSSILTLFGFSGFFKTHAYDIFFLIESLTPAHQILLHGLYPWETKLHWPLPGWCPACRESHDDFNGWEIWSQFGSSPMEILEALFDTQHRHIVKPEIHGKKTHYVWYPISLLILVGVIWVHVYILYQFIRATKRRLHKREASLLLVFAEVTPLPKKLKAGHNPEKFFSRVLNYKSQP